MSFFQGIIDSAKDKIAEKKEKKEFLQMVEESAKPIRRKAYFQQVLKDSIAEGAAIAKAETERRLNKKKAPEDFGIGISKKDEWKHLDNLAIGKSNKKDEWGFLDNIGTIESKPTKGDKK